MIQAALVFGFITVFVAMAITLYRIVAGPSLPDRILALDTMSINGIALLMLVGIQFRTDLFFEAALLIAMLGFISTVSLCKHAIGRSVIE